VGEPVPANIATLTSVKGDPALTQYWRGIDPMNLMPLWERTSGLRPGSPCVPWRWRYSELRPLLMQACDLISKKDAERRVLCLENPSLRGTTYVTQSLFAGLQVINPGEIAPSHRHTPNALRFIIEGSGAYTAVEGERTMMEPGDFIITANWTWHDHGNLGTGPVVWMDGLDTPFTKFFGATFREDHPHDTHEIVRPEGDAQARYGAAMLPLDEPPRSLASPLFRYPYERTRAALKELSRAGVAHPSHGYKLRYANPATGGHPFPTMTVFMQLLPTGFDGRAHRATDGTVFSVVEGSGTVHIGNQSFDFAPKDIFVVPPWEAYRLSASNECVIFSYSDRAAQEVLGFYREDN
jgi:gentisate 1,2-dioxygenase